MNSPYMDRRKFLSAAGVASATTLGGCLSALRDETEPTSIALVELLNSRSEKTTFHLSFEAADEVVFWETFELDGTDPGVTKTETVTDGLPIEILEDCTVRGRVGDKWESATATEYDCAYVNLWAREDERVTLETEPDDRCPDR